MEEAAVDMDGEEFAWQSCGGGYSRQKEQLRQRPSGRYLRACSGAWSAWVRGQEWEVCCPLFSGRQGGYQKPRWAFIRAQYNFLTHTPPAPAAQHRPPARETLPPAPHQAGAGSGASEGGHHESYCLCTYCVPGIVPDASHPLVSQQFSGWALFE